MVICSSMNSLANASMFGVLVFRCPKFWKEERFCQLISVDQEIRPIGIWRQFVNHRRVDTEQPCRESASGVAAIHVATAVSAAFAIRLGDARLARLYPRAELPPELRGGHCGKPFRRRRRDVASLHHRLWSGYCGCGELGCSPARGDAAGLQRLDRAVSHSA